MFTSGNARLWPHCATGRERCPLAVMLSTPGLTWTEMDFLATMLPFAPWLPFAHDGVISSLRTYSPSALRGGLFSPRVAVVSRRPQSM